jgi:hypothetical protein
LTIFLKECHGILIALQQDHKQREKCPVGMLAHRDFITGLSQPWGLALLGNNLLVSNFGSNTISEYDASTGATRQERLLRTPIFRFSERQSEAV